MPNYGNKMTVAAADEPPYLTVGTDVSAKYKGAFCEAKIIDVNKHVKLRVLFDGHPGSYMIDDTELKQGSPLEIGSKIEARHPEKKHQIYINATIQKILDQSRYTVVFDDGDQCILRRNSICLKSGKHFAESETLDQLPLTNPEHFGNPVKVGQASLEQNNHINSTNHNVQQVANHSTTKLSNNITNNNNNSSASNSGSGKNGYSDFNNQSTSTTDKNGKGHNNIKLETEKPSRGKSVSSPSNINSTSITSSSAGGPPGRRGGGKGRKRRESTSASSKQVPELDDEPGDDSQDSADLDPSESDVDFSSIEIGVKLMVQYGKGKVQNVYEAKVNKIETNASGRTRYFVHYTGWNNRYDEWITKSRIIGIVADKDGLTKDTRSKQVEPSSLSANSNQMSSIDVTVKSEPVVLKDKEKDREVKQPAKAARRSRHLDAASSPAAAPNHISSAEPSASNLTSTVTANKQGVSATPSREKDRDREKDREKEKDIPSKTRRTRLPVDNATSASSTDPSSSSSEPKVSIKHEEDTKEKEKSREKGKDKEKDRIKEKDWIALPVTRPGRPRLTDAISTAQSAEKAQVTSLNEREKEPPTKTRRSRHVDAASSANATPANSSASSTASSTPPRSDASQSDRDKARDLEKDSHSATRDVRSSRQVESAQGSHKSNSLTSMKDRDSDKDLNTPAKTRASKQTETRHTASSSSLASTTVSSSSLSSVSSVSTGTTTTSSIATTASSTGTNPSTTTTSDTIPLSTPSISSKDREKEREKERERDRDKEPPTKIRRSRQSTQETSGNVCNKDTSATTSTNNATTTTITTSTTSSTSSTASSSSSSSCSLALPNPALSALVSLSEREREKFDDELIIDEPDCDKRISILQDKIMTIRHTYMALKAELADLDRRRKRPRMERSSSDHINNFNSSVTCRN